jgi:hypothetical protein
MVLNEDTLNNDSKKISELKKLTSVTKKQENSWIPLAQYNERTGSYVNAAINLQAITSYSIEQSYAYATNLVGKVWIDLMDIGNTKNYDETGDAIAVSSIASNLLSYTFTYTTRFMDWQIVDGSYIPDYYVREHPDSIKEPSKMKLPDYDKIEGNIEEEKEGDDENIDETDE